MADKHVAGNFSQRAVKNPLIYERSCPYGGEKIHSNGDPRTPGVLAHGQTHEEAIARVQTLAWRVLAERLEHGEAVPVLGEVCAVRA